MPYISDYRGTAINKAVLRLYLSAGSSRPTSVVPTDKVAIDTAIAVGQRQITITHALMTTNFVLALTPNWNTNCCIISKSSTTFTVGFSDEPLNKGAVLTWRAKRGYPVAVPSGSETLTITHGLNNSNARLFFTPWWNTPVSYVSKSANAVIVSFATP